jgi:hypothetical protein
VTLDRVPADFDTPLLCIKCGQEGTATWEPERPDPVGTSGQFYLRLRAHAKTPRLGVDIVCSQCGTVHRDKKP